MKIVQDISILNAVGFNKEVKVIRPTKVIEVLAQEVKTTTDRARFYTTGEYVQLDTGTFPADMFARLMDFEAYSSSS
jgi:hypothetical protein